MKKVTISFFMIFTVMMIFSDITSYGKSSVLGPGFYIEDSGDGQQSNIESDDLNIVATGLVKPLYVTSTSKDFIQLSNCNEALYLEVYMDVTDVINNIITFEESNVYYGKLAGTCNPNLENSFYEVKYTLSIEDIDFTNQSIVFTMIDISYFIFNNSNSFNDKLVQNPVDVSESYYVLSSFGTLRLLTKIITWEFYLFIDLRIREILLFIFHNFNLYNMGF